MHVGHRPRGLNLVYFSVELWRVLDGTMHHSPSRRRWTGGTTAVNGMEERDRVGASTNLCTQLWLLLAGDTSVLAQLTLTDCSILPTVAVTGRRNLRPRPVDFILLFSYSTVAVTGRSVVVVSRQMP